MPYSHRTCVACNLCGSTDTRLVYQKWTFHIVQCVHCGLVYVNPRAFSIEDDGYFEGPYLSTIERDGRLDPVIDAIYQEIVDNLHTRMPPGKLLDVGCAMGHFLAFAQRHGWQVEGVECSPYAARYAAEHFGFTVHPVCVLQDAHLLPDTFNSCVLVEVIEHLPDPWGTLAEVWRLLQPGGLVYLTTPNFSSYASMLLRDDWRVIVPNGHLYYFDGDSLGKMLASAGFTDVENLTGRGEFANEVEIARTSGLLKLSSGEQAKIQSHPAPGRAESLVMCARKPLDSAGRIQPARTSQRAPYEGCLVRRAGESFEESKVYFVEHGQKRWVMSAAWIVSQGLKWPEDVQFIAPEELAAIPSGPVLP